MAASFEEFKSRKVQWSSKEEVAVVRHYALKQSLYPLQHSIIHTRIGIVNNMKFGATSIITIEICI